MKDRVVISTRRVVWVALLTLFAIPAVAGADGPGGGANRIEGTVTDDQGNALEGAVVTVLAPSGVSHGSSQTDATGRYELAGLADGEVVVRAWAEGMIGELWEDVTCWRFGCSPADGMVIPLADGTTVSGIDFALAEGSSIAGRVRGLDPGPLPLNSQILLFDEHGNSRGAAELEDNGRYIFRALVAGSYFVLTSIPGLANELYQGIPCHMGCDVLTGTPIVVDGVGTAIGIDFDLVPNGTIEGRVVDAESGEGVAMTRVRFLAESGGFLSSRLTDEKGFYTGSVPPGRYKVRAAGGAGPYRAQLYDGVLCPNSSCNHSLADLVDVVSDRPTRGVDFSVQRRGGIHGTVLAADTGLPIPHASVIFTNAGTGGTLSAKTGESGRFAFWSTLDTATYFVSVESTPAYLGALHDGLPCWGFFWSPCDVTAGTPIEISLGDEFVVDFILERGGSLRGQVTDAVDGGILDAQVVVIDAATSSGPAGFITHPAPGRFAIGPLPPGAYFAVTQVNGGYRQEAFDDAPCATLSVLDCVRDGRAIDVRRFGDEIRGIDFALDRHARVNGTVLDPSGAPIAASVRLFRSNGSVAASTVSQPDTGAFRATAVLGQYVLHVAANGHEQQLWDGIPCELPCDLSPGTPILIEAFNTEIGGVDVVLRRFGAINGTVRDDVTGAPIADATVLLWDGTGQLVDGLWTDADGRFARGGLATGNYRIAAARAGYRSETYPDRPCPGTSATCDPMAGALIPMSIESTADLNIELLPLAVIVFGDGFEAGDTSAWSGTSP